MLSVVMSSYNNENTIAASVESILNQDFKNFEFLIIDDASNDNTYEILKKYENLDSRVKVLKNKKNIGLTKSLNLLIKEAKYDLIARQDADDISEKNRFTKQIEFIKKYNLDACTTRARNLNNMKKIPGITFYIPIKFLIKIKNPFIHGTLIIKKDVLEDINFYDENYYYAQDYKLFIDLLKRNYKIRTINKLLYNLNTINNISTIYKKKQKEFAILARKSI